MTTPKKRGRPRKVIDAPTPTEDRRVRTTATKSKLLVSPVELQAIISRAPVDDVASTTPPGVDVVLDDRAVQSPLLHVDIPRPSVSVSIKDFLSSLYK